MKVIRVIAIIMFVMFFCSLNFISADSKPQDPNAGSNSGTMTGVTGLVDRVWATAITVVQVLAVGCVVFAGLRYMYASADRKADIKKGMMYLAIGAVFVFATTTVMKFVYNVGNSIM